MSTRLNRTEHYRHLANKHRRLASNGSSNEIRNYHLLMAKNFSTLAGVVGVEDNTRPANSD